MGNKRNECFTREKQVFTMREKIYTMKRLESADLKFSETLARFSWSCAKTVVLARRRAGL